MIVRGTGAYATCPLHKSVLGSRRNAQDQPAEERWTDTKSCLSPRMVPKIMVTPRDKALQYLFSGTRLSPVLWSTRERQNLAKQMHNKRKHTHRETTILNSTAPDDLHSSAIAEPGCGPLQTHTRWWQRGSPANCSAARFCTKARGCDSSQLVRKECPEPQLLN